LEFYANGLVVKKTAQNSSTHIWQPAIMDSLPPLLLSHYFLGFEAASINYKKKVVPPLSIAFHYIYMDDGLRQ
jgi:hypothetical protein